jgi:hypothetical protein
MKLLDRLRKRSPRAEAGDPGSAEASSADEQRLPIARFDRLDRKQVIPQLSQLSQVELAAVEAHERSHRNRPGVLTGCAGSGEANCCPDTTPSTPTRSSARWPAPTQQPSRPGAHTNATTETAAKCEQKPHASSRRHRQAPQKIAAAKTRPRSSKPVSGPDPARHELTPTARRR